MGGLVANKFTQESLWQFPVFSTDASTDFNSLTKTGIYIIRTPNNPNKPNGYEAHQGYVLVFRANVTVKQSFITDSRHEFIRFANLAESKWSDWKEI